MINDIFFYFYYYCKGHSSEAEWVVLNWNYKTLTSCKTLWKADPLQIPQRKRRLWRNSAGAPTEGMERPRHTHAGTCTSSLWTPTPPHTNTSAHTRAELRSSVFRVLPTFPSLACSGSDVLDNRLWAEVAGLPLERAGKSQCASSFPAVRTLGAIVLEST